MGPPAPPPPPLAAPAPPPEYTHQLVSLVILPVEHLLPEIFPASAFRTIPPELPQA